VERPPKSHVVELVPRPVAQPLLHVLLQLKGGKHPALLKAIARIVLLSRKKSPCKTVDHPSLVVTQKPGLAALQGLLAVQIQSQRGSEVVAVSLGWLHGHHPESERSVAGHGATGKVSGPTNLVEAMGLIAKRRPNL
jgi:hypothetical protein